MYVKQRLAANWTAGGFDRDTSDVRTSRMGFPWKLVAQTMSLTGRLVKHIEAKHLSPGNWSSKYMSCWINRARKGIPPAWHKFMLALITLPCENPQNESNMLATKDWQLMDVSGDASSEKKCYGNMFRISEWVHQSLSLRMRRDNVLMSSECWKKEFRILLGYCMIVFRTLKEISTIRGSVACESVSFKRTSSVPNLSKSWTLLSVPFARDPIIIATFSRRLIGFLSFWSRAISRGTNPLSIINRFCLFDPIIRFFILFVASKHSSSSSENKLSR